MFHDDDMTQLTAIDPAHDLGDKVHPDSPEARAIFARITAELGDPAPAGRSKRTTPVRMAITMAGAVAVISASALILAPDPERPLGPSEASAALHQLAIAAAAHKDSDPPLQAGKYYYERTVGNGLREEWISRDGMLFASGAEFDGIQRMGNIGGRPGVYATFGDSSLTYDQVLDLPRDPGRLYGYMAAHVSVDQDDPTALSQAQAIFFTLREFLIANPLPADLRAAFYEAAARIPGIEFLGRVPNEEGTVGLGVGMWRSGGPDDPNPPMTADGREISQREDIIFDQQTGEIIGDRTVVRGHPHGEAVVETAIVDRVGVRPGDNAARSREIARELKAGRIATAQNGSSPNR